MRLADIKLYFRNAKRHSTGQILQIASSIREFGFNQPLVVDKERVIVVGHGRYEAAKLLGLAEVPVIEVDLSEEKVRAYRLADNKLNESEWEMGLVIEELKGLSEPLIELTGFDKDLLIEPSEKDDQVPDVPEEPKSKRGDLYELGKHRVLCGDSTKKEEVERLMDGKKADMVFTDPPYNVNYRGGARAGISRTKRPAILNDKMSSDDFYQFLGKAFSNIIPNVLGAFYVCMSSSELHNLWKAFTDKGGHWQGYIIWIKDRFTLSRTDYQQQFELIMYGLTDTQAKDIDPHYEESEGEVIMYGWNKHQWYGGRKQGNVWHFERPKRSVEHPTMKPVMLCAKAIVNSSMPDRIVLDTFLGSGSTLIAAEKTGRICYGMEIDPGYCDVIVGRYVDYVGNDKIKKNGEEITWQK